jgi:hypothetical protein
MNVTLYEQVGKVIYGVQRLDSVLHCMDSWLSGEEVASGEFERVSPAEKFDRRMAVAKAYFSANRSSPGVAVQYERTAATIRDLECVSTSMMAFDADDVANVLARTREAHIAVADLMDALGYNAFSPERLRERGAGI